MHRNDSTAPRRQAGLFAHSNWDAISVAAALAHLVFVIWLVVGFSSRPSWVNVLLGFCYSYAISWNINSVSHNFIHTPYFCSRRLNYVFSIIESLAIGFSQTFYTAVHLRHHAGNSDRPDADGNTLDWLSIYRHGMNGRPENVWRYVFFGFFRNDTGDIYRLILRMRPFDAKFGRLELAGFGMLVAAAAIYDWTAVLFLIPFYYFGECLSQLNGYYEHFNGNPDRPLAWGVSSYQPIYNFVWFRNGYHAEHHYRPGVHWTKLSSLHQALESKQRAAGTHTIATAHALGFLARANRRIAGRKAGLAA